MGNISDVVAELGARQGGAVERGQLIAGGVTRAEIEWALQSGRLLPRAPGVMAVAGAPVTRWHRLWVAHLASGPRSVIGLESAGDHWGFDALRRTGPTALVPHASSPTDPGLSVRRTRRLEPIDIRVVDGLPFTTPARTVVDLAAEYGPARLGRVLDSAHFSGSARYEEVGGVLLRIGGRGRRGSGRLARLLDERCGDPLAESVLEQLLADLLRRAGLELGRDAVRQHPLPTLGQVTGTVDLYLPGPKVIVEADGRRWHERQQAMKRDRDRDFAAAQVGVLTVRLLHEHLTSDPVGSASGLRRVLATRPPGGLVTPSPELGAIAPV